ncbi:MAG: Peptidase M23 [Candidatus Magasanikbacteria bacterium GW2011_GWA2_43_9]|nr:MAG: Peptidase M23 [Candidatus Magasanikbacteria bacterium GW2011_GWA2_43_9]
MRKRTIVIFLLAIACGILFGQWYGREEHISEQPVVEEMFVEPLPVYTTESFVIEEGDTFAVIMERMGYDYEDMQKVLDAGEGMYDFTQIVLGKKFVMKKKDGLFDAIVYDINSEEQAVITKNDAGDFVVTKQDIAYDVTEEHVHGTIEASLFVDGNKAGLDGAAAPAGDILAARFVNRGKEYTAVRFVDPDGGIGYYANDGTSLQKPFLKAPLAYSRISSGYSNARFHPVTQSTAPHLAIDYAAPMGTAILSTGDGVVTTARYTGGYGNFISIHHNDTWVTQYAHLSRYAVSAGDRVEQGQIIGYVGSTGWSTGPHLHYEMVKNGTKVNPLNVELPAGDPIPDEWRAAFDEQKNAYRAFFEQE